MSDIMSKDEMIDEPIELLQKVAYVATMPTVAWDDFHKALALLKVYQTGMAEKAEQEPELLVAEGTMGRIFDKAKDKQPAVSEPGEFTKNICEILDGAPDYSFAWLRSHLREACDLLDAQADVQRLTAENKRLDRLVFSYESVNAPVNPLLTENRTLQEKVDSLTADLKARDEQIETMRRIDSEVRDQNARNYKKVKVLTADLKAREERIAELEKTIQNGDVHAMGRELYDPENKSKEEVSKI